MSDIVTIDRIGHHGDGVAETPDGLVYVPFTLPDEIVRIADAPGGGAGVRRARLVELLEPSPDRAAPPCRHFGACGGCALQMMPLEATRRLKRDFVVTALAQQGLRPPVEETVGVPVASRRRAVLTALRAGRSLLLGYHERLSNRIVSIEECLVLAPALQKRVRDVRAVIEPLVPARGAVRVTALLTAAGLDLDLAGTRPPSRRVIPELAVLAQGHGVVRLSLDSEPLISFAEAAIDISGVRLVPPPGAFVQASAEAEAAMVALVTEHLAAARHVADLFAGVGTFALALARRSTVLAVESGQASLNALAHAHRQATGLKRIETARRDLFAFPLSPAELKEVDGVVFDPPRAGAKAQAAELAASSVPRIAAVSCNPGTFARDAHILVAGGYLLERVIPIDQFVYSAETEVVGLFRRA